MKLKFTLLCSLLCGLLLSGCGAGTTPEIIMPDQPMTSSVNTNPQSDKNDTTSETAKKEAANPDSSSDADYNIYLITMDLTDNYWKSIDDGCLKAAEESGNNNYTWSGPDAHDDALQSACIEPGFSET